MTLLAFFLAIVMVIRIQSHYRYLERANYADDQQQQEGSGDRSAELYPLLASTSSGAMTFVALYTMVLAVGLTLYGSTAIVGFTSFQGVYIAPCFPITNNKMKVGIFGGAVVVFANLLMLSAVIFGEFRVSNEHVLLVLRNVSCFVLLIDLAVVFSLVSVGGRLFGGTRARGCGALCCRADSDYPGGDVYVSECSVLHLCHTFVSSLRIGAST